jgi:flagellar hook-associated protein 3 FlgL
MRISTSQLFQQSVNNMMDQQVSLSKVQMQLSSGKRLANPSDDPAASLRNLQLLDRQSQNTQHLANLDSAASRLELEGGALTSGVDLLQRVRELAVQSVNGALSPSDLKAIEVEARSVLDSLVSVANTQNANGEFLFAGYQTGTAPISADGAGNFTYNGDQGQPSLQISPTRQIAVGDNAADVFMGIRTASGGVDSVFDIANRFADSLAAGTTSPDTLTDIDAAMSQLLSVQADVGSRQRAVDQQTQTNQSFGLVLDTERSKITDLDYVEAISRYNQEMTAYQASQQVFAKMQGLSLFNYVS